MVIICIYACAYAYANAGANADAAAVSDADAYADADPDAYAYGMCKHNVCAFNLGGPSWEPKQTRKYHMNTCLSLYIYCIYDIYICMYMHIHI